MRGLEGKVAIVAGGAGGIGTAASVRLAEEGALVLVADIDGDAAAGVAAAITTGGGRATAATVDIADETSVRAMVAVALDAFGGVDLLHCNAADLRPDTIMRDTDAVDIDLALFDHTIAVDLRGHLLCTRHVVPELVRRGGGAIVYTSSAAAFIGEPARVGYASAKAGVNALARHVAGRWGKEGVRANAVAPGLVIADAMRDVIPQRMQESAVRASRSTRNGRPEDIAAAVAFLLSDDAGWINGQVLGVDGGTLLR